MKKATLRNRQPPDLDSVIDYLGGAVDARIIAVSRRLADEIVLTDSVIFPTCGKLVDMLMDVYGAEFSMDGAQEKADDQIALQDQFRSLDDLVHALSEIIDGRQGSVRRKLDPRVQDRDILIFAGDILARMADMYGWEIGQENPE